MGLNTVHVASNDFLWCENLTNGTKFKAKAITHSFEKMNVVTNISVSSIKVVLVINGRCEISVGDLIKTPLFPTKLMCQNVVNNVNQMLYKKRTDTSNFTGTTEVALS